MITRNLQSAAACQRSRAVDHRGPGTTAPGAVTGDHLPGGGRRRRGPSLVTISPAGTGNPARAAPPPAVGTSAHSDAAHGGLHRGRRREPYRRKRDPPRGSMWVPITYATRRYSWITPPARS